jgi:TM2 domain-containing membrane protein YozV
MFELPLGWIDKGVSQMKYLLLWGLGVPIPVLIIGYLIFH